MNKRATAPLVLVGWLMSWLGLVPGLGQNAGTVSSDNLSFRNGDQLGGRLVTIAPPSKLQWRHPDASQPIDFVLTNVAEIELARRARPAGSVAANCRVYLEGESEFEGAWAGLDQESLILDTWFAGRVKIARSLVRVVQPISPRKPPLFEGPTGLEGWTLGKVQAQLTDPGQWQFRQGSFYARNAASIARDLQLPDVCALEFDLAWQGAFHLAVALYADTLQPISLASKDTEPDFGGFYSLQLNSYSADLLPVKRNEPLRYMGQVSVPVFGQKSNAHIEIRSDKRRRLISLMVDGTLIRQWLDNADFAGKGRAIRFVNQGSGLLRLSRIRIYDWDGLFEEKPTHTPGATQDLAQPRNGDRVQGVVTGLREGKVLFSGSGDRGNVEVEFQSLRQLEFHAGAKAVELPTPPHRIRFQDGGVLGCTLERWSEEGAVVNSPATGSIKLHPASLRRIQFQHGR